MSIAKPQHQAPRPQPPVRRARGVSLVEALVALAVMSFGMLGVVGVQATLRFNAEVSKQRSEAVRIGQEEMESLRSFVRLDTAAGQASYADIQAAEAGRDVKDYKSNTTYRVIRKVEGEDADLIKRVTVEVAWADRNGTETKIVLASSIAKFDPALTAGLLRKETVTQQQVRPQSRHVAIPSDAKNLGDGFSALKQPEDGNNSVVYIYNNETGLVVAECTIPPNTGNNDLNASLLADCDYDGSPLTFQILEGHIRFWTETTQPGPANSENPISQPRNLDFELSLEGGRSAKCRTDAPRTKAAAESRNHIKYRCRIPTNNSLVWVGYSTIKPKPFEDDKDSDWYISGDFLPSGKSLTHRLCRYTPAKNDDEWVPNDQHPWKYGYAKKLPNQSEPAVQTEPMLRTLPHQNFLVVLAQHACPTDVPANPALGDYVNSNTLEHKPLDQ